MERCLAAFEAAPEVDEVWLVLPRERLRLGSRLMRRYGKLKGAVAGGPRRRDSVERGLSRVRHDGVVLVHDAARPFVSPRIIASVVRVALRHGAAVPVVPVADTLKSSRTGRRVERTVRRDALWCAQTPQGFRAPLLRVAYRRFAGVAAPDDAALVERLGGKVALVRGSRVNFKVTFPEDLALARRLVRGSS